MLENRIIGCHGNHAFSHSPNMIMFLKQCLLPLRVPSNNLEIVLGVQGMEKLDALVLSIPI